MAEETDNGERTEGAPAEPVSADAETRQGSAEAETAEAAKTSFKWLSARTRGLSSWLRTIVLPSRSVTYTRRLAPTGEA